MSFSQDVKNFVGGIIPQREEEKKAELMAFYQMNGLRSDENHISFETENIQVAKKVILYLKVFFPKKYVFKVRHKGRFKKVYYGIRVKVGSQSFFDGEVVLNTPEEKAAYLRGAFLARGSVTDPKKGYHLELWCPSFPTYMLLKKCLLSFGIDPKGTERKEHLFLYLKDGEMISDFLKVIGAIPYMFQLEDTRVMKEIKNMTNRRNNCDLANLDKTIEASNRQVQAIRNIIKRGGIDRIPPILREIAYLRMAHPEASLTELGSLCSPPLKKAAVNYRLKRIIDIGEQ